MSNDFRNAKSTGRKAYVRPELTVYGSVRNLTGGSSGPNGDTMSTFMQMP